MPQSGGERGSSRLQLNNILQRIVVWYISGLRTDYEGESEEIGVMSGEEGKTHRSRGVYSIAI